ncbi:MAG: trehalose-6-phosphate synthase [Thermovirgaceae bacterium]|nr:trehalose-6-phosphate synthase [Thermovirgaceae bacterium]
MTEKGRLVIVSNRLPLKIEGSPGNWLVTPSSGGLVSALSPVLRDRGGIWIGWTGTSEIVEMKTLREILGPASDRAGYRVFPVLLSKEDVEAFYYGFSNEVIWPLFHDLQTHCRFEPEYWDAYRRVNSCFAQAVRRHTRTEDFVWVHDYQMIPVARILKKSGVKRYCAFFLHIPFPAPDIFLKLPWRDDLLRDLMEYEFVGFQTPRDRRNFTDCLRALFPGAKISGRGPVVHASADGREMRVAAMPISIDYRSFRTLAKSPVVLTILEELRKQIPREKIVLGVDRLDYTKGIPQRIKAIREFLRGHPEYREKLTFIQIVVPSREDVPSYRVLREEIERLVSSVNGEFSTPGWVPVHYMYKSIPREELVAYYRLADLALVTPLKDGMNLVAKEYCTCQVGDEGVLILSEFAGAAAQMHREAILVNPYDVNGIARAIHAAVTMPLEKKKARMRRIRVGIRRQNVFWWVDNYLRASTGKALVDFPEAELAPVFHALKRSPAGEA